MPLLASGSAGNSNGDAAVAARQRALRAERARVDVVAQVDLEVDDRRAVGELRLHLGDADLARPDPPDADAAVDAAEVEPQPVPAVGLHRGRAAPVGAHDELVARAGLQRDAGLERQVLALVLGFELAVDPHARAMVDGLEADRVEPVDRHVDVRPVPADAAAERALALLAVDLRGVGDERRLDELAAAVQAGRVALVVAEVVGVLLEAPQPGELLAVAGAGVDRRRAAVGREDDGVGGGVGRGRRSRHEPGHGDDARSCRGRQASPRSPACSLVPVLCHVTFPAPRARSAHGVPARRIYRRVNTAARGM